MAKHSVRKPGKLKFSFKLKNKTIILSMVIIAVLLVVSVFLLVWTKDKANLTKGADQMIKLSSQGGFECDYAEAQKLYPFSEGVFKVTNDRVAYLSLSGTEIFSSEISYQNPYCLIQNNFVIIADIGGYSFSLYNKEKQLLNMSTENKIKSIAVSKAGLCAAILDCDNEYGQVVLYNPDGQVFGKWISYNSGYPISCSFNDDTSELAITTLNTNSASVIPSIKIIQIINHNGEYESKDYALYTYDADNILMSCFYCKNKLFAFNTTDIFYLNDSNAIETHKLDNKIIKKVEQIDGNILIIYSDSIDQVNKLLFLDDKLKTVYDSILGNDVHSIIVNNDKVVICVDKRIFVADKTGKILSDTEVDEDVIMANIMNKSKIITITSEGVRTFTY